MCDVLIVRQRQPNQRPLDLALVANCVRQTKRNMKRKCSSSPLRRSYFRVQLHRNIAVHIGNTGKLVGRWVFPESA